MLKSNKKLGTEFEQEVCELFKKNGFWVHFLSPDRTGAQPFDIIAVKNGNAYAIDCKTSVNHIFSIGRLEDNQVFAFQKWIRCGNLTPLIIVKYKGDIKTILFDELMKRGKVDLDYEFRSW